MRWLSFAVVFVLMLAGEARGQAEEVSPLKDPWNQAVLRLSQVLADGDAAALVSSLAEGVTYRAFDAKSADAVHLLARTKKGTVLFNQGYSQTPQTLAADIARSVRDAQVPETIKRSLIPQSEAQTVRANATAEQWIHESLEPKAGERIGVIVLWCEREANDKAGKSELLFVLLKADQDEALPRMRTILYGHPQVKIGK